jgi:hypothetical protein
LVLEAAERETLERWARRRKTAQALGLRARIVLRCASSAETNGEVAEYFHVSREMVGKWR